jgi:aminoglycoside phosphotransferase (APT) family kinase protein
MRRASAWLGAVAAAHREQADTWTERGVTVRRVAGGANNAVYRVETDGEQFACKLCVDDGRQRARREYGALGLLQAIGLDLAPQPLWLDESCSVVPYPAVAYRWLRGTPLGPNPTARQLAALIDSIQCLHNIEPGDVELRDAWFHWFDFAPYLGELQTLLSDYGPWLVNADTQGRQLRRRLTRLVEDCSAFVAGSQADPSRERVPLRLCRVDPNLANALWCDDGRLRWVDWEYSGWGDPALDLADLRWHAALDELGSAEHDRLRDSYRRPTGDTGFQERLAVWDRLIATRWAFLILRWLWSTHEGPDRERLTRPTNDVAALRARLVRFIERAEQVISGSTTACGGRGQFG